MNQPDEQATLISEPDSVEFAIVPLRGRVTAWKRLAACADSDPELFFPVGTGPAAIEAAAAAKAICARCPVRELCASFALSTNQEYGIWGGLDEDQRRAIRRAWRNRRRQTPLLSGADTTASGPASSTLSLATR